MSGEGCHSMTGWGGSGRGVGMSGWGGSGSVEGCWHEWVGRKWEWRGGVGVNREGSVSGEKVWDEKEEEWG